MVERMRFLILHGYAGSGPGHWQRWLADRLRQSGHDVAFPDLPDPDHPRLALWLDALAPLRAPGDVVVCHSLACCLWLHHRAAGGPAAERVLLVAPPCPEPMIDELATFFPVPLEPRLAREARIVCSDADPYCPAGAIERYAEALGTPVDVLPDALHVNPESGYGPWPAVEAWAYGENQGIET
jgi:predicted alpha/beta hydrolase family esterase